MNAGLCTSSKRIDTCEIAHKEYIETLLDRSDKEKEGEWILKVVHDYDKIYDIANMFISRIQRSVSRANKPNTNIKIENVKFEIFEGDLRSYGRFKEEFIQHIRPTFKSEKEAFVLKSYLAKNIREEVDNLGEDAVAIWKRLDEKYGNKRKLIDCILADIKKLNAHKNETPSKTLEMINVIEKAYGDLKGLGMEIEMNNSTIVSFIEERLPPEIDMEWINIASAKDNNCSLFPSLLELLQDFKRRIEYKMSDLRRLSETKGLTGHTGVKQEEEIRNYNNQRKQRCWLHPDSSDHSIWLCQALQEKSAMERYNVVRDHRACYKCLSKGHFAPQCRRNFVCREKDCNLSHHTLLHGAHVAGASLNGSVLFSDTNKDVLLQIQKIQVLNNTSDHVNMLWDGGSTLSFITFSKARELKLQQQQKLRLQIEKVGGDIEEYESHRYYLDTVNNHGEKIVLSLLGINKISSDIVGINTDVICAKFNGLTEKYLDRPTEGEIDCLIGYNYAAFHPVKIQSIGHLLLLKTQFGYVIGGTHPSIVERTNKVIQKGTVNRVSATVEDFYTFESLGIQCKPRCGSCKCGKCHPGGKGMSLQEEKEFE